MDLSSPLSPPPLTVEFFNSVYDQRGGSKKKWTGIHFKDGQPYEWLQVVLTTVDNNTGGAATNLFTETIQLDQKGQILDCTFTLKERVSMKSIFELQIVNTEGCSVPFKFFRCACEGSDEFSGPSEPKIKLLSRRTKDRMLKCCKSGDKLTRNGERIRASSYVVLPKDLHDALSVYGSESSGCHHQQRARKGRGPPPPQPSQAIKSEGAPQLLTLPPLPPPPPLQQQQPQAIKGEGAPQQQPQQQPLQQPSPPLQQQQQQQQAIKGESAPPPSPQQQWPQAIKGESAPPPSPQQPLQQQQQQAPSSQQRWQQHQVAKQDQQSIKVEDLVPPPPPPPPPPPALSPQQQQQQQQLLRGVLRHRDWARNHRAGAIHEEGNDEPPRQRPRLQHSSPASLQSNSPADPLFSQQHQSPSPLDQQADSPSRLPSLDLFLSPYSPWAGDQLPPIDGGLLDMPAHKDWSDDYFSSSGSN